MFKYILILFTTVTFSQDWSLTQNESVEPGDVLVFDNVHLNGFTIDCKNGSSLSIDLLFGSGSIVAFNENNGQNKPSLSICSYDCAVTPIIASTFGNQSIPEYCDGTLNVIEFGSVLIVADAPYVIYDLLGRVLKIGVTNSDMFIGLPKNEVVFVKVNDILKKYVIKAY